MPGESIVVDVEPAIAVFNVDGTYFALDDTCTHDRASLADGYIDGDVVECPFHLAKFSIRTGQVLSPPAYESVCAYEVTEVDGTIYVNKAHRICP
jgi:biphenyl 2,3-dioxygenase ferredoxin subunit